MRLLENKNVLVTGGSRGIGYGIMKKLAKNGANVAFTHLGDFESGKIIAKELADEFKVKIVNYVSDASNFEECHTLVENVVKKFGSLDVLINNAGITRDNLLLRLNEKDWDDVMNINLKSCFNMVKASSKTMMKQRGGSIINISSVVGLKGNPGQSNYSASKAGILGFTKSIALELGSRGVRSNAVAPGFIETKMTAALDEKTVQKWKDGIPLKRGGTPEDVANACLFLASDLSSYITGQTIQVDGGMLT